MNTREAMQALLEGKKLRWSGWNRNQDTRFVKLREDGRLVDEAGFYGGLHEAGSTGAQWELYEEPNPHTVGTFAWAREEAKRGRNVCRPYHRDNKPSSWGGYGAGAFVAAANIQIRDIDATDWELW